MVAVVCVGEGGVCWGEGVAWAGCRWRVKDCVFLIYRGFCRVRFLWRARHAQVSKKAIEPHVKFLVLEICCDDKDGEEVDVPFVQYNL